MRSPSRFALGLGAIVAVALVIRLVYVLFVVDHQTGSGDFQFYNWTADMISEGHGFSNPFTAAVYGVYTPTGLHPPLWSYVLSVVSWIFGPGGRVGDLTTYDFTPHRLLGAFLGSGTVLLLGLLGRRASGSARVGLVAAGIAAVMPGFVGADGSILSETLYGVLFVSTLLLAYRLLERPTGWRALAFGLMLGLCALTRSEALLLVVFLGLPVVWLGQDRWSARGLTLGIVVVGLLVPVAPWVVRNTRDFHVPVTLSTQDGALLVGSNCPATYYGRDIGFWSFDCLTGGQYGLNEAQQSARWRTDGLDYAGDHLGRLPLVVAARLGRTFSVFQPFRTFAEAQPPWIAKLAVVVFWLMAPLAVWGAVVLRRQRRPLVVLLAPIALVVFITVVGQGFVRYRYPADLCLTVLAAVAAVDVWTRLAARWSRSTSAQPAENASTASTASS